jgi:hypothetical protein
MLLPFKKEEKMKLITTDQKETETRIIHLQYRLQIATFYLEKGEKRTIEFATNVIENKNKKEAWILEDWERCFEQEGNN